VALLLHRGSFMKRFLITAPRRAAAAKELNRLLWINLTIIAVLLFLLVLYKSA
jgi:hypothetical protein